MKEDNKGIIGIDFGTTTTLVSYYFNNTCEILCLENAKNIIETVFQTDKDITEQDIRITIRGERAWKYRNDRTYYNFKPLIGDDENSLKKAQIWLKDIYKFINHRFNNYGLGKYKTIFGIPVKWESSQKITFIKTAREVGFKNILLIPEPIAAILGINLQENIDTIENDRYYLFFDFGGGTLDLSLMKIPANNQNIKFIYSGGNPKLGGRNFDYSMMKYFVKKEKLLINTNEEREIESLMKDAKADLFRDETTIIFKNEEYKFLKSDFMKACQSEISKIHSTLENFFKEVGQDYKKKLTEIIKIGGASNLFFIEDELKKFFQKKLLFNSSFTIPEPQNAVVKGLPLYYQKRMELLSFHNSKIKDRYENTLENWKIDTSKTKNRITLEYKKSLDFILDELHDIEEISNTINHKLEKMLKKLKKEINLEYDKSLRKLEDGLQDIVLESNRIIDIEFGKIYSENENENIHIPGISMKSDINFKDIHVSSVLLSLEDKIKSNLSENQQFTKILKIYISNQLRKIQISILRRKLKKIYVQYIEDSFSQILEETKYPSFDIIWKEFKNNLNIGGYYEEE